MNPRRLRPAIRWLSGIAVALALWPFLDRMNASTLPRHVPPLRDAEFLAYDGEAPPSENAAWQEIRLPDVWRTRSFRGSQGWYRLRFAAAGPMDGNGLVYLPAVGVNAAVHLNGEFLGDGGRFEEPIARHWLHPLAFAFDRRLLRPSGNTLLVRVAAAPAVTGFLDPLYVGSEAELAPLHARRHFLRVTAVWGITASLVLAALFTAALWAQYREDASYGWYALATLSWAIMNLHLVVTEVPVPTMAWMAVWYAASISAALLFARYVLEFLGEGDRPASRAIVVGGFPLAAVTTALAIAPSTRLAMIGTRGWAALGAVAGGYAAFRLLARLRQRPDAAEARVLLLSGFAVFACGIHDVLVLVDRIPLGEGIYGPYSAPVAVIGSGWLLLRRFVMALRRNEASVLTLEDRVHDAHAELEATYESMRAAEGARVLSEERGRIMRDMHDGLGGHLVSTLAILEQDDVRPEDIAGNIRSALDDLRLVIDSLEPLDGELLPALAMLRARMQPRLAAAGVTVEWAAEDVPPLADLGPHKVLQVLRIAQEAVTTALRRVGTGTIRVRIGPGTSPGGTPGVFVEIGDDAPSDRLVESPDPSTARMEKRARDIGSDLEVDHGASGTSLRLWVH